MEAAVLPDGPGVRLRHRRRCVSCGAYLAHDNPERVCSPCSPILPLPWHDRLFGPRVLAHLHQHRGEWTQPLSDLGYEYRGKAARDYLHGYIRRLRRRGHAVIGHPDGGYAWLSEQITAPGDTRLRHDEAL